MPDTSCAHEDGRRRRPLGHRRLGEAPLAPDKQVPFVLRNGRDIRRGQGRLRAPSGLFWQIRCGRWGAFAADRRSPGAHTSSRSGSSTSSRRLRMEWLWCWPWKDDSLLSVLRLIGPGHASQEVVLDIQLFIDAVEEGFAERSALEIGNRAMEQLYAGGNVGFGIVIRHARVLPGEDTQSTLESVDAVHAQQRQPFVTEKHLVLPDRLLDQIQLGVAFVLAPGERVGPTGAQAELAGGLGHDALEDLPIRLVQRGDGNDHHLVGGRAAGERGAPADEQRDVHEFLLQLGGNVFEGGNDRGRDGLRVPVEARRQRRRDHVRGECLRGGIGDIDARGAREAKDAHDGLVGMSLMLRMMILTGSRLFIYAFPRLTTTSQTE